jgi:Domain of unknown function (DUF4214)
LLHRLADAVGLSGFTALLAAGGTLEQVESMILASPEYYQTHGGSDAGFLAAVYHDVLNRPLDVAGQAGWTAALAHGSSRGQVAAAILESDEYRRDLVQTYYESFLGRPADQGGLAGFVTALAHGQRDEDVMAMFLGSDEYFAQLAR